MIDKLASLRFELRQHAFFEPLGDQDVDDLIDLCQPKILKNRTHIFQQGDLADSLYIVLSGCAKICTTSTGGKETVLAFIGAGEVLGEIAVLDGGPRTATAVTIKETRVLQLQQKPFLAYLSARPHLALHIIKVLCSRLRKTDEFVIEMTTLQAGPRLAKALLRLAEQYGKPEPSGGIVVDLKLSQANLGAHAGIMRENVNRQLKLWEDEGVLAGTGGVITLYKPEALEEIADGAS